ncbi:DUF5610 domain-containing protein [Marinimicrobium alkaliphilum]|uniref:DUF5610 domain-containing protein n=1 Tax=Marinimicrobium alkaliphilum TaxID=2202654 RepID=UPI000DBAACD6|nr:DUF5610 domain-containing protein [Marinimicrobium alkaliphilum]
MKLPSLPTQPNLPDNARPQGGPAGVVQSRSVTQVNTTEVSFDRGSQSMSVQRQEALSVVDQTLAKAYERIAGRGMNDEAMAAFKQFEPLTAEKVANNILGFIERRLQMDAADGATPEQLEARLEAGLKGFEQGFAEAAAKLEALSMLNPEIQADIDNTYERVIEGIEDLRLKFLQDFLAQDDEA